MMEFALALGIYIIGAVTGVLIGMAFLGNLK